MTEYIAICSLLLNLGVAVVGATWGIAKIKDTVRDAMDDHRKEFDGQLDTLGRSFGETVLALRQKIHEIETWARDEFVRKGSFEQAVNRMEHTVGDQFSKLEKRLERMELKIDSKT